MCVSHVLAPPGATTHIVKLCMLDPGKADVAIELPDCLTCLAFHPEDPALLASESKQQESSPLDLLEKMALEHVVRGTRAAPPSSAQGC